MTAAEAYAARVAAVEAQGARILARTREAMGASTTEDRWGGAPARIMRADPRREPEPELAVLASYVEPTDVLVDVGGGSGRYGLPLALHCREVINVEPSPGMLAEFAASAAEAGIADVRTVQEDWLTAEGIEADVVLTAHVTYFVRDIVPFIERLEAAARRRVLILLFSAPPPMRLADLFPLLYGEPAEITPSYRELLPVLWEMGILSDVRVIPQLGLWRIMPPFPTAEEAVSGTLRNFSAILGAPVEQDEQARQTLLAHVDELFTRVEGGFRPAFGTPDNRGLLITWETRRER